MGKLKSKLTGNSTARTHLGYRIRK